MFEMKHVCADGVTRVLGMAFDSATHPRIFVRPDGSHVTEKDFDKMKRARTFDELLPSPHVPASDEDDKEREVERRPDIKALRKYLHENTGLSWDVIEDACELCEQAISERGEVTDELPTAGPGGARNLANSRTREGGEKVFKSPGRFEKRASLGTLSSEKRSSPLAESEYRASPASDSASFFAMFPDAERIGTTYGSSQFDPAPPLTAKARKIARDSVPGSEADRHFREMFPDAPEVGEWLPRRW